MRLLVFSWEYPPVIEGGLGRHVRMLSERLVRAGAEVHVVTRGVGQLPVDELRQGVRVHRVVQPPFPHEMEGFLRWVRRMNLDMAALAGELCAEHSFDLVHSHDWLVAQAAERTAGAAELPWVVTVHATEHGRHQGWVAQPPQSRIHTAERAMVTRASHVITCSDYMSRHVAQVFGVQAERISAIPNGIDPTELVVAPEPELAALRERFARPDERLVLMVGRLVYEKGFHLALEALAPIMRRDRSLRYVVAGTGIAEAELRAQVRRLRLVRRGCFIGWADDDLLHGLYRVADLCIVPSIYEPFGLVALEAMASGCLCIVADTGGLREVVPANGTAGLRFRPGDAGSLRRLLERALTDEQARRRLVAEARQRVRKFDWDEVTRQTLAVFEMLIETDGLTTDNQARDRRSTQERLPSQL